MMTKQAVAINEVRTRIDDQSCMETEGVSGDYTGVINSATGVPMASFSEKPFLTRVSS